MNGTLPYKLLGEIMLKLRKKIESMKLFLPKSIGSNDNLTSSDQFSFVLVLLFLLMALLFTATGALAQEAGAQAAASENPSMSAYVIDNLFLFVAAVLVLFMQAGFAMVEVGLNAAKNTANILFKNLMDLCLGAILFYVVGYHLMYPGDSFAGGYFGFGGLFVGETSTETGAGVLHPQIDFLFQVAFAATAATIVSGAVAGRMKFNAYLTYSAVLTAFIYPISGFWKWGGGWLDALGFHDFAGSVLVHAVGGFAGLAGAIFLGPRIGRFGPDGLPRSMPGHNLALSALGVFILWVGWYGFNPGSQLAIYGADNVQAVGLIAVNTTLAAAAGATSALLISRIVHKSPDLTFALNGALAGLVGITANCDGVTNCESIVIGAIAGGLVIAGAKLLDRLQIDDPVGAWPVHGLCGVWGGLATGIFADHAFMPQLIGTVVIATWSFSTMCLLFAVLKAFGLLRVSERDELRGLDISEHRLEAYYGFQIFKTQ